MDRQASATRADLEYMLINELAEPKALPFLLLKDVTNNFSDKQEIGRGASAVVYKGSIGNRAIAVKKLYITSTHEDKFKKEIDCLMRVKHKNIVRFLGYCSDAQGFMTRHNGKLIIADTLERLLCFEYLHVGSLDKHITDATCGFEWSQRYQIIVGVCQGLHRLHEDNILHLDLKPGNILLDDNMLPKIADFGLARCLEKDQTKVLTEHIGGTFGYIAPELLGGGAITAKTDLYSLGAIIMEILTGGRQYNRYRVDDDVLEKWIDRLGESRTNAQLDQIRVCAEIGIECSNINPAIRPDIKQIIDRLGKTGSTQETQETDKLLRIQPTVLVFRLQSGKLIPCPLQLTNDTDEHVAFKLSTTQSVDWSEHFMTRMPIYGIVPPRSTYTLILTVLEWEVPHKRSCIMVLQSCISADNHIRKFRDKPECEEFFKVNKARNAVHEVELGAFLCQKGQSTPSEIVSVEKPSKTLYSVDTHPTKQWIITGHDCGHVRIWNHETKSLLDSFKVSQGPVYSVKFIARKQWFISGSAEGLIHVYSYEKEMQKITSFRAHDGLMSLAVHPTQPYVLSWPHSRHHEKKLWNWEKGWLCTQIFEREYFQRDFVCQVAFDPKETNRFASTSEYKVKVWSLDSPKSNYTLPKYLDKVNFLEFFTRDDQQYLVTGSHDMTAKIWDMQMEKYVPDKLQNLMSPVASLFSHRNLPILLTCSSDGTSHFWSSKDFR
ncbi:uncharacterized protein LOC119284267 [Triticum dicoccoides]|uniref:uncharacterized protein LOC119284267 n=1 Tax=Triticum dicoccoides TaxID=85692 RepID=UPI0018900CC4|nr:uncharacterized protein LOC119284267 [Triticum dicoccoides]